MLVLSLFLFGTPPSGPTKLMTEAALISRLRTEGGTLVLELTESCDADWMGSAGFGAKLVVVALEEMLS